ncbi:hypothetical protein A0H81_11296 [Grifola frondosa]|uniref:Uncharacterized protein n=1 Tax=Grifola frondosa TaxID=5627 RepID=A0A1C7LW71_GRIFR|nr:hypothetical protein A0H81_11296 [Grifola frondosa]
MVSRLQQADPPQTYPCSHPQPTPPVVPPSSPTTPIRGSPDAAVPQQDGHHPSKGRRARTRHRPSKAQRCAQAFRSLQGVPRCRVQARRSRSPRTTAAPVKHRTVIDQSPTPLYCSDECRLADLQSTHGAIDINYNPTRCGSPQLPPVPHNSYSDFSSVNDESDSSSASVESRLSMPSPSSPGPEPDTAVPRAHDGYARLAAMYGFPPLPPPPPPPMRRSDTASSSEDPATEYQFGNMMAARRIQAALFPEQPKRPAFGVPAYSTEVDHEKPIPGWTDGSQAWRASVYSVSAPRDFTKVISDEDAISPAYKSFVASSHRARGVYSTLGEARPGLTSSASTASLPAREMDASTQELYKQYSDSFTRRSESRLSLSHGGLSMSPTGAARSLPGSQRREVSLVKRGAEGRLLVPDVKMRRVPSSVSSYDGSSSTSWGSASLAARKKSPLTRQNSNASVQTLDTQSEDVDETLRPSSLPTTQKVNPQMRSWSYTEKTYPLMPQPPQKEKRIERRVVDGVEQDVVVRG